MAVSPSNDTVPANITRYTGNDQFFLFFASNTEKRLQHSAWPARRVPAAGRLGQRVARGEQMIDQLGTGASSYSATYWPQRSPRRTSQGSSSSRPTSVRSSRCSSCRSRSTARPSTRQSSTGRAARPPFRRVTTAGGEATPLPVLVAIAAWLPQSGFTGVLASVLSRLASKYDIHYIGIGYKGAAHR